MRAVFLVLVLTLGAIFSGAKADPLDGPTVNTTIRIERERGGACSELHSGNPRAGLNMTDVCHGWETVSCFDKLLVRGDGVMEDQAQVLFTDDGRTLDLVRLVDGAISARWPGDELLRLRLGPAACDGETLVVPFSGSRVRENASGSAYSLQGALRIISPKRHSVSVRPAR